MIAELAFTRKCSDPDQRILLFTDLHYPAHSEKAVDELGVLIEEYKPTKIVNLGDVFDNVEASRWVKDTLHIVTMETGKPLPQTYAEGIELLDLLYDKAPKGCEFITLFGNHDDWTRKQVEKLKHITGDYNPLLSAFQNSRHVQDVNVHWPNNEFLLLPSLNLWVSHDGAGTSGNHAKSTWVADFEESVSRIYGHAHDPQHWFGLYSVSKQARDDRFTVALGAMCDRSNSIFAGYSKRRARFRWRPTVMLITVKDGLATFEQQDLTPDEIPTHEFTRVGKGLNV